MLEIKNKTPFGVMLIPGLDKHGHNYAVIVVKSTFAIHPHVTELLIVEDQIPPQQSDVFNGEPGKSSIKYEADTAPLKPSVDIVVNGHIYAPANYSVTAVDASLQIGQYKKTIRAIGDRIWHKNNLTWQQSPPQKFQRMPLLYENAFGGAVAAVDEQAVAEFCVANPVGKGFVGAKGNGINEGVALPNIEDPANLIQHWLDCPVPAGFGFIGRNWEPRLTYAGTYDKQWQQERMPLLPLDFDDRYNNAAHPHLVLPALVGGEEVIATQLSESGYLQFSLPKYRLIATAMIKGRAMTYALMMDTLVIEPDKMQVLITWRVAIPCANQFLYIENVTLDWRSA